MWLPLTLSVMIGLLLGLLGGGGSILTVPMLVYMLHIEPKMAILTAFVVVGISSFMALIPHARRGFVCWKSGIFFGFSGMLGAFGGGRAAAYFSGELLMVLFGLVSFLTGLFMLRAIKPSTGNAPSSPPMQSVCPLQVPYFKVLFYGFFVGALTGLVGVGGGFMIVPALTLWVGLPMQGAIGTSLLIISMNALAGMGGYSQHVSLDLNLTLIVTGGAIIGSTAGSFLSVYVNPLSLKRAFGLMVLMVAAYVLFQATPSVRLMEALQWLDHARLVLSSIGASIMQSTR